MDKLDKTGILTIQAETYIASMPNKTPSCYDFIGVHGDSLDEL